MHDSSLKGWVNKMKKTVTTAILALAAGLYALPAQAAMTPDEQAAIVAQVVQQLEAEKKLPHYVSVSSDIRGADSNLAGDGAQGKHSIAIGGAARTTGSYNVYIGGGLNEYLDDPARRRQVQTLYGEDNVIIGYRHDLGSAPGKDDLHLRQTVLIGARNTITQGNVEDAGGPSPVYSMGYGYRNTLIGSYAVAFGQQNKVRNSSRVWDNGFGGNSTYRAQDYAWVIGKENDVFASGYVMGDKNFINTLPTYDPDQVINKTGPNLYVLGRMNLIGSSERTNTFVDSGVVIGIGNVMYANDNRVLGDSNRVHATMSTVIGRGNRVGIAADGTRQFQVKNGVETKYPVFDALAFGSGNYVRERNGIAGGRSSEALSYGAVAFGQSARAEGMYATAIGQSSATAGNRAVALGYYSHATADLSVSLGARNNANLADEDKPLPAGKYSSAVGYANRAGGKSSVAVGIYNNRYDVVARKWADQSSGEYSVSMGARNNARGEYATALGVDNLSAGLAASAVGYRNITDGQAATAFGYGNRTLARYAGAFGTNNTNGGDFAFVAGGNNILTPNAQKAQVFGYQNIANGYGAVALGSQNNREFTKVYRMEDFTLPPKDGFNLYPTGDLSVAVGTGNLALGTNSIAVGRGSYALRESALAVGGSAVADGTDAIAVGRGARVHAPQRDVKSAVAIGTESEAATDYGVALGAYSRVTAPAAPTAGYNPLTDAAATDAEIAAFAGRPDEAGALAALRTNAADKLRAYEEAKTVAQDVLHRYQTQQYANEEEGRALLADYEAKEAAATAAYTAWQAAQTQAGAVTAAWTPSAAAVAVGHTDIGLTRRITGVAAGAQDTDAVNVAQLKAFALAPVHIYSGGHQSADGAYTVGAVVAAPPITGLRLDFGGGLRATQLTKDGNSYTLITLDKDTIAQDDSLKGKPGEKGAKGDKGEKGANGTDGKSAYQIWEAYTDPAGVQPYKGKTEADFMDYMKGKKGDPGDAGAQGAAVDIAVSADSGTPLTVGKDAPHLALKGDANITTATAADNTVRIALKDDITVKSVTAGKAQLSTAGIAYDGKTYIDASGIHANDKKVTHVAAGEVSKTSTDAVNGAQLHAVNETVAANTTHITSLKQTVNKLGGDIADIRTESRETGAMNAALAALKPLDFDPLQRSQVMAGISTYRGKQAVALGVAHHSNEDTLVHAGVSYAGQSELMANLGISRRFGDKSDRAARDARAARLPQYAAGPMSSVYVMQDEMAALRAENLAMKERMATIEQDANTRIAALEAQVQALLAAR